MLWCSLFVYHTIFYDISDILGWIVMLIGQGALDEMQMN